MKKYTLLSSVLGIELALATIVPMKRSLSINSSLSPLTETPQKVSATHKTAEAQPATIFLQEDFSKCTQGSEITPDPEGIVGELPQEWVSSQGWLGATAHQAGGCLFIDQWQTQSQGQDISVYLLDTPVLGVTAETSVTAVRFRAKGKKGAPLYLINADYQAGITISVKEVALTQDWQEYTVQFTDCTPQSFIEFQTDETAYFIDDITVSGQGELPAPKVLPATEITASTYKANWTSVASADGYLLYPKTIRIADGMEPFWLLDTDFAAIAQGSIESPIEPTVAVSSLDAYVDQPGWLVRLPLLAQGALGLTNKYLSSYGNSLLQSPTLDLSSGKGEVHASLRYLAQEVDMFQVNLYDVKADGKVSLRSTKMIYTDEEFNVWKETEFTLGGGTSATLLVILLPETTRGTVFFDRLQFYQVLDEGTRYTIPEATISTSDNHAIVTNPDAKPDDSRAYSVKAYRIVDNESVVSAESNTIFVGRDSDEIPTYLTTPDNLSVSVEGASFTATWQDVPKANAYEVTLYRRHESNGNESVAVISEDFNAIRVGTTDLDHPRLMHEEGYDRLDEFTKVPGWEVFQGFYVDGAVGILGYWNMLGVGCYMKSPEFDLSADDGNMTLSLKVGTDYYEQGATVYLAHDNTVTGNTVYDDILPLNEMSKGFHPFTTTFKNGRKNSYLVFFPYGYGMSYFDDILVTQKVPAGINDTRIASRIVSNPSITLTVPDVNTADQYFVCVRALWLDSMNREKVSSSVSQPCFLLGLQPSTYLTGRVVDEQGVAIPDALLTLTPVSTDCKPLTAVSNRWGLFRINNVTETELPHTLSVKASGYRTGFDSEIIFDGLNPIENKEYGLRKNTDGSSEVGTPSAFSENGAACLYYNNSESETIYPASLLGIPDGAIIKGIAYDGYCETDKEVTANITLTLENTYETSYPSPNPSISTTVPFWKGSKTLNATGSQELPDCIFSFDNPEGYIYTGHGLRVHLLSTASKNSDFHFMCDKSCQASSIYRYWSKGDPTDSWAINASGLPVMRITYTDPLSGLDKTVCARNSGLTLSTAPGSLSLLADYNDSVGVFDLTGRLVRTVRLSAGVRTTISMPQGIYLVENHKVIIK